MRTRLAILQRQEVQNAASWSYNRIRGNVSEGLALLFTVSLQRYVAFLSALNICQRPLARSHEPCRTAAGQLRVFNLQVCMCSGAAMGHVQCHEFGTSTWAVYLSKHPNGRTWVLLSSFISLLTRGKFVRRRLYATCSRNMAWG